MFLIFIVLCKYIEFTFTLTTCNPLTSKDIDILFEHQKDKKWQKKFELYQAEKKSLIGKFVTVVNGSNKTRIESKWKIIDNISDPKTLTTRPKPKEEIGIIDLNFEELLNSDFPVSEIFLRLWPDDAIKQLCKLNRAFQQKFTRFDTVTLKELTYSNGSSNTMYHTANA